MNDADNDALRRENQELREKLARAASDVERYRASNIELMDAIFPYQRPTDAELEELMKPDEGESLSDIIAGYRRKLTESKR